MTDDDIDIDIEAPEAEANADESPDRAKHAAWLERANAAFSTADTWFSASVRLQAERDIRQFQGVHPRDSKYWSDAYKPRSKLFRPKTRSAIRSSEAQGAAAFFSTDDVVSISARDANEPLELAAAELHQDLLQLRLTRNVPWFAILMGAYQEAQSVGVVTSYQEWDYERDCPVVRLVPIENLRIDPAAPWDDPINGSPYVIELLPMYVQDVRARIASDREPWMPVTDAQLLSSAQESDSIRLQREHGRTDPDAQATSITDYTTVLVHRVIMRRDGQDWVFYTLGQQALLSTPVPLEEVYWHGKRPYVMGMCMLEAHKLYPASKPQITRDLQAEINEQVNLRIDNVRAALQKRYFAARNRMVDVRSLVRGAPGSVTLMNDPSTDVKVIDTGDVTSAAFGEQDRLNGDFDDLAGAFSGGSVATNRRLNETVGGMQMLTSGAASVAEYELRTFAETWVEPVLRQIVALEQHYESDAAILAVAGEQAALARKYGLTEITEDLVATDVVLRVNVGVGSTNTANSLERFLAGIRALVEVFGQQAIQRLKFDEVAKEVFGKSGYKDGRRFLVPMDDPEIEGLVAQIEQLQQALNAKHPPELLAAQVEKLREDAALAYAKRVQTGVQASYAAVQAAGQIAMQPAIAPVADQVMAGAGYRLPQPMGDDPNFPVPPAGMAPVAQPGRSNTSPAFPPLPQQPETGMQGIETQEIDQ